MTWCGTCGAQYDGPTHNCGWVTITKDRYRELVDAEVSAHRKPTLTRPRRQEAAQSSPCSETTPT